MQKTSSIDIESLAKPIKDITNNNNNTVYSIIAGTGTGNCTNDDTSVRSRG